MKFPKEIVKPLASKNDFVEVSMLPNKWEFLIASIISLVLYYADMVTDYLMLYRFYIKMTQTSEISRKRVYSFFFYSSLTFTILPILSLILFGILKRTWKNFNGYQMVFKVLEIFAESLLNIGLIKL